MRSETASLFTLVIMAFCIFGVASEASAESSVGKEVTDHKRFAHWPTHGWAEATPETQNVDSEELFKAVNHIYDNHPDIYSLLVVKNGYLILENYFKRGRPDRHDWAHSVTKSYMSTLIGIAIHKGLIDSVEQPLSELLPEKYAKGLTPEKQSITLKSLLTMSAGFGWRDGGSPMMDWFFSPDWAAHALQLEQVAPQGARFNYNSTLSHLLSVIVTEASGMSTEKFADRYLFKPLGMTIHEWITDPKGYANGGYGLRVTPRDMAKLGYLFLNNGQWDGQQIVSSSWVKDATTSSGSSNSGYGYQWWLRSVGEYSSFQALGRRGQNIVVVPEQDLVIVVTSETAYPHSAGSYYPRLYDIISESVDKGYLADVPKNVQTLLGKYTQAMAYKDLNEFMSLYSDDYYHSGLFYRGGKEAAGRYYKGMMARHVLQYTITGFEREGDVAHITGIKSGHGLINYPVNEKLILERDQWKFYGNQNGNPN